MKKLRSDRIIKKYDTTRKIRGERRKVKVISYRNAAGKKLESVRVLNPRTSQGKRKNK